MAAQRGNENTSMMSNRPKAAFSNNNVKSEKTPKNSKKKLQCKANDHLIKVKVEQGKEQRGQYAFSFTSESTIVVHGLLVCTVFIIHHCMMHVCILWILTCDTLTVVPRSILLLSMTCFLLSKLHL